MKIQRCLALLLFASALLCALPLPAADPAGVAINVSKGHIDFLVGKELITRYHIGANVAKPYFWPLNGPGGVRVTRAWPMEKGQPGDTVDHVHQKSAWFCHGDVIPEGIELKDKVRGVDGVDFWAEGKGHGVIACTHVGEPKTGSKGGAIQTRNDWRTADGTKILEETRTIALHHLDSARLLILDIDLHAGVCPITFGDTKEGSMGVRVNDAIALNRKGSDGVVTSSDGKTATAPAKDSLPMWGQVANWNDYSGTIAGKVAGIAVFDDPHNTQRAGWHTRAYGLMAANPFGRGKSGFPALKGNNDLVKLAKGEHLKLRYGILIHPGDAKEGKVAECYEQFVRLRD